MKLDDSGKQFIHISNYLSQEERLGGGDQFVDEDEERIKETVERLKKIEEKRRLKEEREV